MSYTIASKINQLSEELAKFPLPEHTVKLYNEFIESLELYLPDNKKEVPIEDEEIRELWLEFERQRFEISGKKYSNRTRKLAIKKILELAGNDWLKFKNILEWTLVFGYPDITPQILNYIETKKNEGLLFRESKYADYKEFVWFFHKKDYYNTADFRYYYDKILSWSESKQIKRRHWGFASMIIIENDQIKDKLVKIDVKQREFETINGEKMQNIYNKILFDVKNQELKQALLNSTPQKVFRLQLFLSTNKQNYETIEKYILDIKPVLYKYNIRQIIYNLKKQ